MHVCSPARPQLRTQGCGEQGHAQAEPPPCGPPPHPLHPAVPPCRYALTIGWLEPSYVIQRFLDAQRIHSLTGYLERLHEGVRPLVALGQGPGPWAQGHGGPCGVLGRRWDTLTWLLDAGAWRRRRRFATACGGRPSWLRAGLLPVP